VWWRASGCAAIVLVVTGCTSAGHVTARSTPTTSAAPTGRPGGLIGVIDVARVTAVCADARQAQTVVQGGLPSAGTESLLAAATLLERPPVDPTAATAAAAIRADVRTGHPDRAVAVALAFCRAHGGG
jgi:hypothetical protein